MKRYVLFMAITVFLLMVSRIGLCQKPIRSDGAVEHLLNVGNHRLFIRTTGDANANITIVFESGGGGTSGDWKNVISFLPSGIRTVAYDRAGSGKSEKGPLPQTMAQNVFELHALLKAANIKGPFILVGQSMGGLIARLYLKQYGKDVAGLVLVDPTHESSMLGSIKYGGWVRLREKAAGKPIPKPQINDSISPGYDSTADYMSEEFQNIYLSSLKQPREAGNLPVIILGAGVRKQPPGTPDEQWKQIRAERDVQIQELVKLSTRASFILDPKSGHYIHYDNPAIVAEAIEEVIKKVRDE